MGKLYVICGHGAGDPGACGNGYTEAERVRALGAEIKARGGDSVVLLDTSRNWYADRGINSLTVPSDSWLVELHMDSAVPSARGGHVIIKAGIGGADAYDRALAESVSSIFPGRSSTIVERSDLANPNRAAARGINYRLVENGFITNAADVQTFNSRLGELADAYLSAFGLETHMSAAPVTWPERVDIDEVEGAVYRLYNPNTGDHLFTQSHDEAEEVAALGWEYEGVGWNYGINEPIYRLYNPSDGLHMLTSSHDEHDSLMRSGWVCEGKAFGAGSEHDVYRLYNKSNGLHMYTISVDERDVLVDAGWFDEGVAFKAD